MATVVSWNGVSYTVPATGEENWGGTTKVDGLLISLANNGFNKTGGTFTLAADADFGVTAGLASIYYKSRGTIATTGVVRLALTESIAWGTANNVLTADASSRLTYNGVIMASALGVVPVAAGGTNITGYTTGDVIYASSATVLSRLAIGTTSYPLMVVAGVPAYSQIVDASVATAAAITRSKLASGTADHVLINSGAGVMTSEASLAITRGGTGQATAQAAIDALLPSQGGNSGKFVTTNGTTSSWGSAPTATTKPNEISNISLSCSVGASALTITALQGDGSALGAGAASTDIAFRNVTATTGTYAKVNAAAITALVISSGSTLGHTSAIPQYIYVYAINNAGTIVLGASSTLFDEGTIQASTAEGGAGAADSATVLYGAATIAARAIRLIGRLKSTQATAGTWATAIAEVSPVPFPKTTGPTIQTFLSGSAQTYTTPAGVKYIRVRLVGGGGGGGAVVTNAGATGGTTTFGTSLLTATGGVGGTAGNEPGGAGGTATLNAPAIGISFAGMGGFCGVSMTSIGGTQGASSVFGGGGKGGTTNSTGGAAATNTGSGGGGGSSSTVSGGSGGAGAYIEAIINSPDATYTYTVGASGGGGSAGTQAGGAGAAGIITVEEYYN